MSTEPGRQSPEVSVIIACYNATGTLPKQLEALSRQQDAPAFEVILSDNGSDDNLIALADEWAARLDVQYVWSGQMPGAAYARNVGMSVARADKWLFCDADDVVFPDWVGHGSAALDVVPVYSGGAVHATDDELSDSVEQIWARLDSEFHMSGPDNTAEPEIAESPADWPIVMGGNFGIRRAAAYDIGGFDAAMVRGVEDNDLAIRLETAGTYVSAGRTMIVYRKRNDPRDALRRSFVAGEWHMALVERHGAADRSPQLRGRRWISDPVRVVGAALKNSAKGSRGDWSAVWSRAGSAAGLWYGWLKYRARDGLSAPLIGAGLGGGMVPDLLSSAGTAVLVLSPHLDDALFSCSELIRQCGPEVWTVFAGDPSPALVTSWDRSCGFSDSHALITQRHHEDFRAFEGTGARVRHLDMLDGAYTTPVRRRADLGRLKHEVSAWISEHHEERPVIVLPACAGVAVEPGILDRLAPVAEAFHKKLPYPGADPGVGDDNRAGDNMDAPGVSDHAASRSAGPDSASARAVAGLKHLKHRLYQRRRAHAQRSGLAVNGDHLAVRDAVLDVVLQAGSPIRVLLAEDLPYLWSQTGDGEVVRLADRLGKRVIPHEFHVDRSWKCDRLSCYVSQLEVMDPVHHRFNRADTIPPVERCWELLDR